MGSNPTLPLAELEKTSLRRSKVKLNEVLLQNKERSTE